MRPARLPRDDRLRLGAGRGLAVRRRTAGAGAVRRGPVRRPVGHRGPGPVRGRRRQRDPGAQPRRRPAPASCSAAASPSSASRCARRSPQALLEQAASSPFLASLDLAGRLRVVPVRLPGRRRRRGLPRSMRRPSPGTGRPPGQRRRRDRPHRGAAPALGGRGRAAGVRRRRVRADRHHLATRPRGRRRWPPWPAGRPAGWVGAEPLGLHFEGPMIAPTRKGAHPEHWLRPPSLDLVDGWSREAGVVDGDDRARAARCARGDRATGRRGRRRLGRPHRRDHGRRWRPRSRPAPAASPTSATRCRRCSPASPARSASRSAGDLVAGLIVDGHHLRPDFLRTAWRALGPDAVPLGLRHDRRARPARRRRPGSATRTSSSPTGRCGSHDGTLAGSAASLLGCLRVLVAQTGCSVADALATATTTPLAAARPAARARSGSS